jgi:RNA polymerase sigma factor (sigma-70 family)
MTALTPEGEGSDARPAGPDDERTTRRARRAYFMSGDPSDETLMAAYAAGDARAFAPLFSRIGPRVHAFFLRSFRDPNVADELLQTTFLKIHRGRTTYRADLPVRPWIFAIAARVRRDELRHRYRLKEDCDEERLAEAEQAHAVLHGRTMVDEQLTNEATDRVRAALDGLPESQRTVVHLHRYEEMTFRQIAEALGLSEVAVRARAFRAYERLRRDLLPLFSGKATS